MTGISLVLGCGDEKECFPNYPTAPKKDKSVIIAAALVEKGGLVAEDVNEAKIADGTTPPEDIITAIRKLQKLGKAAYFPSGHLSGSKPKPTELTDATVYGLRIDPRPTGEVTNSFVFNYEYSNATQNVRFFNWLRENRHQYDVVIWTDRSVYIIENYELDFYDIGHEITGNAGDRITGGFSFRYLGDGEPVPYPHNSANDLKGFTSFVISPAVTAAIGDDTIAAATCSGKCKRYAATFETTGWNGTFTFSVVDDPEVLSCVKWQILKDCGKTPVESTVAINEATGVVTFTAFNTAGINQYTVVAMNDNCVVGEACFEIIATAQ